MIVGQLNILRGNTMQFDIHTHTIASGHGTSCTIADMAKSAAANGLSLVGISDQIGRAHV